MITEKEKASGWQPEAADEVLQFIPNYPNCTTNRDSRLAPDDQYLIDFCQFLADVAATIPADVLAAALERRRFGVRAFDGGER